MRPRLLDLFCGAGGAAMGYHRAGFDVVGVDNRPQPNYPFRFIQADVLDIFGGHRKLLFPSFVDAIHASPPCQAHTGMSNRWRGHGGKADSHVSLILETRRLVDASGLPYVIENVPGARGHLINPVVLSGEMFGLGVHRPRLFETNWLLLVPRKSPPARESIGVYGKAHDGRLLWQRADGTQQRAAASLEEARTAMGMSWADWRGLAEAVPPAYTELIGHQLMAQLKVATCA